jgi:hypothetical protein
MFLQGKGKQEKRVLKKLKELKKMLDFPKNLWYNKYITKR